MRASDLNRRLLSLVAITAAATLACKTPDPAPRYPEAAAAEGEGEDAPPPVDAIAGRGELQPAPGQLAAGIPHLRFRVPLGEAPQRGPADAPITMVMFSDFECPFCAKAMGIVEQLEREYKGKIRFAYKAFPIDRHPYAMLAALVAHSAAAQNKFWSFHDMLFSGRRLDEALISEYASKAGLDLKRLDKELDALTHGAALRRDLRQGKRLDIRSTPTVFINGRKLVGAQSIAAFRTVINQELALTERWQDAGVKQADLYTHATQHAYARIKFAEDKGLDEDSVYPVPIGNAPTRGNANARLTVIAFTDFRCPYCVRGNENIEALREQYGDDMRIVYRYLPLQGPMATSSALAAWAAGAQGKFWEFHDALYKHGHRFSIPDLEAIAEGVGVDMDKWYADLDVPQAKEEIRADIELGRALGITGTPTYFVNGRAMDGARPVFEFRLLFAEELERADKMLAEGVAPERLYEALAGLETAKPLSKD